MRACSIMGFSENSELIRIISIFYSVKLLILTHLLAAPSCDKFCSYIQATTKWFYLITGWYCMLNMVLHAKQKGVNCCSYAYSI